MLVALTADNKRIDAKHANRDEIYYCPLCKKEVILEKNTYFADQFKHKDNTKCDAFEGRITNWSANWQEQFPIKNREVVVIKRRNRERHKADVKIGKYVLLFRTLPLAREDFNATTKFFKEEGYKVIWIFNISAFVDTGGITAEKERSLGYSKGTHWYWKYPRNFLQDFNPQTNQVMVFFQMHKSDLKDCNGDKYLERIIKLDTISKKSNLQRFTTASLPGSKSELLYALKTKSL